MHFAKRRSWSTNGSAKTSRNRRRPVPLAPLRQAKSTHSRSSTPGKPSKAISSAGGRSPPAKEKRHENRLDPAAPRLSAGVCAGRARGARQEPSGARNGEPADPEADRGAAHADLERDPDHRRGLEGAGRSGLPGDHEVAARAARGAEGESRADQSRRREGLPRYAGDHSAAEPQPAAGARS